MIHPSERDRPNRINRLCRVIFIALLLPLPWSCTAVRDITQTPLADEDIENLKAVEQQMLQGDSPEVEIDRRIAEAVKQMVATLKPEYKRYHLAKYKLGFLEITDIDRFRVNRFHNYVTEKSLTFSFLQPDIARNFNIVERFLVMQVMQELEIQNDYDPRIIDQQMAKRLGRIYGLDVIETGVLTLSDTYVDLNLRMIETERGRIVAVGSAKIELTPLVERWLVEPGVEGIGYPEAEFPPERRSGDRGRRRPQYGQ